MVLSISLLRRYKGVEKLDRQILESYIAMFGNKYPNINMVRGNLAEASGASVRKDPQELKQRGPDAGWSGGHE